MGANIIQEQEQSQQAENVQSAPKLPVGEAHHRASPINAPTQEESVRSTEPEASPVRTPAEKYHHQHSRTESTDSTQKPKLVGKAFAGNLPTSVLRQMSARSSEGRSPSISSNKSTTRSFAAGSPSAGGSPALSNHSPVTVKSGIPLQQLPQPHPQQQQQANSPGQLPFANAYQQQSQQRMPVTSPGGGYPMPGQPGTSPIVDPSIVAHQQAPPPLGRQPRNLEQLLQYANGGGGGADGLSPPVIPRSGMNGNGPMMPHHPPHHPFGGQGQAGMEQFIPPHLMQHMSPHMAGPVGPGPMLQPHHHLPPQVAHQFHMQREMMTPPSNEHPYMGNVPPPHMMGNG